MSVNFCTQLNGQTILIHRWDPNRYYHLDQSGPGSNSNEGVLHIPQSSRTGFSPLDGLESYASEEDLNPFSEMELSYSTAPLIILSCSENTFQFYNEL